MGLAATPPARVRQGGLGVRRQRSGRDHGDAGRRDPPGDWLGYRYDFGDCWNHDIEVEQVHRAAKTAAAQKATKHMRALRHRKGWKYQVAKTHLGTTRWDPARWDRAEINTGLASLAKL